MLKKSSVFMKRPLIVAHRGASGLFPGSVLFFFFIFYFKENSKEGFLASMY
jgi:glycerophosphoryl diester phosphodiesterase